ncbi:hypothetical protein PUNSTDRAFT_127598 [Punctularia strigosozonata HHB-11173 SS5]|uniref:uncharacterized protein n=1 Tax=Punctularia strigosozonata (strain HHB-11173) TaxID=741275 RepID=UPI0004417202|nr:uncharacterized protein PUNSTDRAFT_127598 [Punctularia strigosozonata HHB-11173 SS5]EIN06240.1 hypothetical protein PUNSTDRAFT_127598 [Punctularia strigosozonata HHB-11173 SS5]
MSGTPVSPPPRTSDAILDVYADQIKAIKKRAPKAVEGLYIQAEQTANTAIELFMQDLPLYKEYLPSDTLGELEEQRLQLNYQKSVLERALKRSRKSRWTPLLFVTRRIRTEAELYQDLAESFQFKLKTASQDARIKRIAEVVTIVHPDDMDRRNAVTEFHESRDEGEALGSSNRPTMDRNSSEGDTPTRFGLIAPWDEEQQTFVNSSGQDVTNNQVAQGDRIALLQAYVENLSSEEPDTDSVMIHDSTSTFGDGLSVLQASPSPRRTEFDHEQIENQSHDSAPDTTQAGSLGLLSSVMTLLKGAIVSSGSKT